MHKDTRPCLCVCVCVCENVPKLDSLGERNEIDRDYQRSFSRRKAPKCCGQGQIVSAKKQFDGIMLKNHIVVKNRKGGGPGLQEPRYAKRAC